MKTREAAAILKDLGTPCLIHQPSYSMLNRWVEDDSLLDTLDEAGVGSIVFSPLAQRMLTTKYLGGIPEDSRAAQNHFLKRDFIRPSIIDNIRKLNGIAEKRGQTLAQMAIAWVLRDQRVTSALIGARNVDQLDNSLDAMQRPQFSDEELKEIDKFANDGSIDLWKDAREGVS